MTFDATQSLPGNRARHLPALIAIVLITAVAFRGVLHNEFVSWGDETELVNNTRYQGFTQQNLEWMFTSIHMGHWQPLTWLTFALDYSIWGVNARAYHFTSLALHVASSIAAYFLILELLRCADVRAVGRAQWIALTCAAAAGALLFAVHPLRVEPVAWASERRGVLSGLFYVLCVWCYLRYVAHNEETAAPAHRDARLPKPDGVLAHRFYLLSIGCLALSLLAKEFSISLPIVLLLIDLYPLRRLHNIAGGQIWELVREKIPFFALAAVVAFIAVFSSAKSGVAKSMTDYGLAERLAQCGWGLAFYPIKTLIPVNLSPLYPIPLNLNPADWRYVISAAAAVGVTIFLIAQRRRWPALLILWACYVVIVLPVLGLTQTGRQIAADRYTYLPGVGLSALLAWALYRAWKPNVPAAARAVSAIALVAAIIALTLGTRQQVTRWRESLSLWTHAHSLYPNDAAINNNLGVALGKQEQFEAAASHFLTAIANDPNFIDAHNNFGTIFAMQNRLDEAIQQWNASLQIKPDQPEVQNNIEQARLMLRQPRD